MAAPVASYIKLPDDTGNTGKKVRTQTRTVGSDTVHEHFIVPISARKINGVYNATATLYTVAASAQNGTTAAIGWLVCPTSATVNVRLREVRVSFTNAVATAIDHATAPRIGVQRATFTGTASGASLTPAKRATADSNAQCAVYTASTGLTISLVANAIVWAAIAPGADITTSGVLSMPSIQSVWAPVSEDEFIELVPGEALAIYQIDAGTTSDQRRALVTLRWDEVDNT